MVFAYAVYVPAGIALTSTYASQLLADTLHFTFADRALFLVIWAQCCWLPTWGSALHPTLLPRPGARRSGGLHRAGDHYPGQSRAGPLFRRRFSPASSPPGHFTDITTNGLRITAFAGYETAAALGEEAKSARRSVPASTIGVVIAAGIFYPLVVGRRCTAWADQCIPGFAARGTHYVLDRPVLVANRALDYRTCGRGNWPWFRHRRPQRCRPSPVCYGTRTGPPGIPRPPVWPSNARRLDSVCCRDHARGWASPIDLPLWRRTLLISRGGCALSVVLHYLAVNIAAIRAFRSEFRDQFRPGRLCSSRRRPPCCSCFPCGGSFSACRQPGQPAALRSSRVALPRRHRRGRPSGPTAVHL